MSINNPSTFLDLCQRTRRECQVSGSGPSSVTTTNTMEASIVGWVAEAWRDIQKMHEDWDFMRRSTNWLTVNGKVRYTPLECGVSQGNVARWERDTFRNFHTATGPSSEIFMSELPYNSLRDQYEFSGTRDVRTRPTQFAIYPVNHGVGLGPIPNADYTITADYYEQPVVLENDSDVPSIPAQYIMAIVGRAMMSYGESEAAPEVFARGSRLYMENLSLLEANHLPRLRFSGALT